MAEKAAEAGGSSQQCEGCEREIKARSDNQLRTQRFTALILPVEAVYP